MIWKTVRVGDLGRIVTGKTPPTKERRFYGGDYPFITPSDLDYDSYRVRITNTNLSDEARSKFQSQFLPENAITFTCIASIGKIGVTTTDSLTNQQINSIIVNQDHDWRYVYYLLRNEAPRIRGMCSGVAAPIINKRDFEKVEIRVPSELAMEQRVASVLSTYDDLIENNQWRIKLLEQAARLIYKQWFVHFRFPGHEHTTIIDGIPEGWEKRRLGDVMVTNARSYSSRTLPDTINYVDISSVQNGYIVAKSRMPSSSAPGRARRIASSGDVIWSNVRPNLRAYALVLEPEEDDVFSTGFTVLTPTDLPFSYLYLLITTDEFVGHLINHATGASYPAVRPDDFMRAIVTIPSRNILHMFHENTEPLFKMVTLLDQETKKLIKVRDVLLPCLMNGKVML